jgi:hypothetical protein
VKGKQDERTEAADKLLPLLRAHIRCQYGKRVARSQSMCFGTLQVTRIHMHTHHENTYIHIRITHRHTHTHTNTNPKIHTDM